MKKSIPMFLFGVVVGIAVSILAIVVILPKQMFVVNESKFGFEETVETLTKSVEDNKWSMPHMYDLQATMSKHGFTVNPVKVFSLCKPEHAHQILADDNVRHVSAIMPCRVVVYEKGGKTYVSMLNSGLFSKFMGSKVKNVMGAASSENLQILETVIK